MKKFVVAVAVVALVAFSAPVFASTNPFMDVPMNHWAYDAIGQLAAHGILSGYPDGTYKGKQPTTRYEMASALARALAVVDMTKASKQDVEMMKKLVVEFRDELEALGVRVDDLDERVKVLEDRLGGWKLGGELRLEIKNFDRNAPASENSVALARARLFFDRWFGEDESIHFHAKLHGGGDRGDKTTNSENWKNFYVDVPFFFDSTLTVGRFNWDMESAYYLGGDTALPTTGGYAGFDSVLTDVDRDALGWTKNFGLGSVRAYIAHPRMDGFLGDDSIVVTRGSWSSNPMNGNWGAWELFLMGQLQFTEQFGFDIGGQAFLGDNAEPGTPVVNDLSFKNLWTVFAGLRFNFNENIAFKGIYYHQKSNFDRAYLRADERIGWTAADLDAANHWRVIVDVNQELLKFTSLWLEYGQMDHNFVVPSGLTGGAMFAAASGVADWAGNHIMYEDMKYFRVALGQQWNEKWSTHLFYFGYDFDDRWGDLKEWGLGVKYQHNPNVSFGLNFVKVSWNDIWDSEALRRVDKDDHVVRFRTQVTF